MKRRIGMGKARRRNDIIVGIISYKFRNEENTFADCISDLIKALFANSHFSVMTVIASSSQEVDEVVRNSTILMIDKSLGHDLDGTDGIELIKKIKEKHPEKPIIAMSSIYSPSDVEALNRAGVILRIKKTPKDSYVWCKAIELCADILELQGKIDTSN